MMHNMTPEKLIEEGKNAARSQTKQADCPYPQGSEEKKYWLKGHKSYGHGGNFQNGRLKAEQEIQNMASGAGVRLGNASLTLKTADQIALFAKQKCNKILTTQEAQNLANRVNEPEGNWFDSDVKYHIDHTNYKKVTEVK